MAELTPKRLESYKRLGIAPPVIVEPDVLSEQILEIYYLVSRARRFVQSTPLPLRVEDINSVLEHYPIILDRSLLDEIIFSIDNQVLEKANEQ